MTEKIIKKENVEYKLTCSLFMEWNRPAKYRFKLQQREIGKRKWKDLKGGDLFIYKDVMYEIVHKDKWETYCKYVNDKSHLGGWFSSEYLYCKFSNYTKVEI